MAVAALVLGILGFVIFSWLGPVLGAAWAGAQMTATAMQGQPTVVTWPLWTVGLVMGFGFPLVAAILGAVAMAKQDQKGVAIGGLVTGALGALGGLIITFFISFTINTGAAAIQGGDLASNPQFQQGMQQLQQQLDDPAFQEQMQQAMEQAAQAMQQQQTGSPPGQSMHPVQPDGAPEQPQAPPAEPTPSQPAQPAPPQQ